MKKYFAQIKQAVLSIITRVRLTPSPEAPAASVMVNQIPKPEQPKEYWFPDFTESKPLTTIVPTVTSYAGCVVGAAALAEDVAVVAVAPVEVAPVVAVAPVEPVVVDEYAPVAVSPVAPVAEVVMTPLKLEISKPKRQPQRKVNMKLKTEIGNNEAPAAPVAAPVAVAEKPKRTRRGGKKKE